jgi:FkbM family methyltransferase
MGRRLFPACTDRRTPIYSVSVERFFSRRAVCPEPYPAGSPAAGAPNAQVRFQINPWLLSRRFFTTAAMGLDFGGLRMSMFYKYWIKLLEFLLLKVYRINTPDRKKAKIYDALYPVYDTAILGEHIQIYCPNLRVFKRCDSFRRKEPETLDWIASFSPGATLFDIGANIGLYSLLAAKKGLRVVAFEPESQNFAVMNANVYLNSLDDRISTLNVALSDRNCLDYLYMPAFSCGTAFNQFGVPPQETDETSRNGFKQAVISYTMDNFIKKFPQSAPTHIKIDVDGIEAKIIAGAAETIENPHVQSMLVELDTRLEADLKAIAWIVSKGFKVASQSPKFDTGVYNYIFKR